MRGRRKLVDIAAPQVGAVDDQTSTLQRLAVMFNRWQEDRSVLLANPCEPFDELKYRDPSAIEAWDPGSPPVPCMGVSMSSGPR